MSLRLALCLSLLFVTCSKEEPTVITQNDTQPVDEDATDTTTEQDIDVADTGPPTGTCADVVERYTAFVSQHNTCTSVADCEIAEIQLSCDCHWVSVVHSSAVDDAKALLAEAESCGHAPESFLGCTADAAPVSPELSCSQGTCYAYIRESCYPPMSDTADAHVDGN